MNDAVDKPEFNFFRHTPLDLLAHPPLASSLQSFESCMFLIALGRYPHALTACTFAIESALKAAFELPSQGGPNLQNLVERARQKQPNLNEFPEQQIEDLRRTRNRIVHYGFSPKDDRATATLLLQSAIPYLAGVYEAFFQFDLYDSLLVEFGEQLRNALKVFQRFKEQPNLDPTRCFLVLAHLVRWSVKDSLISGWEAEAAEWADVHGLKFEAVERQRDTIERLFDPAWAFDCPICGGIRAIVCQIVESDLDNQRVTLSRAVCLECGLVIPRDTPFLADAVCADQVEEKREEILSDFGIS